MLAFHQTVRRVLNLTEIILLDIEELTRKTGNYKAFNVFLSMLQMVVCKVVGFMFIVYFSRNRSLCHWILLHTRI